MCCNSYKAGQGDTQTTGFVFHVTNWLGLAYNKSNNFQVNNGVLDVYGNLLPNPHGDGSDYTLKFALFKRRLFFDLTYYTNSTVNGFDAVESTSLAPFGTQINDIWAAIATYTGNNMYNGHPYASTGNVWQDSATTKSTGWEMQAAFNPMPRWRIILNGAKRGNNTTSPRAQTVFQYLNQYIPVWQANPKWMSLATVGSQLVSDRVNSLIGYESAFASVASLPATNYTSNFSLNMIQAYDFSPKGPLSGFTVGFNMNIRGRTIDGFAESSVNVYNAYSPYYAPSTEDYGAMLAYKHKLFKDRVDWRVQLNVRNVFEHDVISPLRIRRRTGRKPHPSRGLLSLERAPDLPAHEHVQVLTIGGARSLRRGCG